MLDEHATQPSLLQLASGTLGADDAGDLFGHLAYCTQCRTRLEALRAIRADPTLAWAPRQHPIRIALRLVVDRARQVAAIAAESLSPFGATGDRFTLAPIAALPGIGDPAQGASVSTAMPRVEVSVQGPGIGSATVVADARRNAVSILLYPTAGQTAAELREARQPRATLGAPQGGTVHRAPFEVVEGASYLLAEFEGLDQTDWALGLELDA